MAKKASLHRLNRIYNKTQGHCAYCGKQLSPFGDWQIEHIIPKSRGGGNRIDNLVAACPRCNQLKKTKTPSEYKEKMTYGYAEEIDMMMRNLIRFAECDKKLEPILHHLRETSQALRNTKICFYMDAIDKESDSSVACDKCNPHKNAKMPREAGVLI